MTTLPTATGNPEHTVVIVEGDAAERESIVALVTKAGLNAIPFGTGEEFLAAYANLAPDCLVLADQLPDMNGLEVLGRLVEIGHPPSTIMIFNGLDVSFALRAMKLGAFDVVERPFQGPDLLDRIRYALEHDAGGDDADTAGPDSGPPRPPDSLTPRERQPRKGRHIVGQYDDDAIVAVQACRPAIGQFAEIHGYFGGEFSLDRRSWIKAGFL
ncbi:MAG: response regulator [Planctomycetota bacterium]